MKVSDAKIASAGQPSTGAAEAPNAAAPPPSPVVAPDRVSTDDANNLKASLANAVGLAASERASRLLSLAQQVRAGTYVPNISRLAGEILAQADLDARLARSLH